MRHGAYYNEIDPYAAQWLRNLIDAGHIAPGDVDERSIVDVRPADLRGYTQAHFFAGIGGWSIALRLAGWDDARPVWSGSCPCQPFSTAGAGKAANDSRHLWPAWFPLIAELDDAESWRNVGSDQPPRLLQRPVGGSWDACEWLPCTDGKARPVEPGTFPLAHGVQRRTSKLRAYGNAIVAQTAAAFIKAASESL